MMKLLLTTIAFFSATLLFGQYTTPDAGLTIDFEYLVENSGGAVVNVGESYLITEDIIIAPTDAFEETQSVMVMVADSVVITAQGDFTIDTEGMIFTWAVENEYYGGFRFEDGSQVFIQNVVFQYGGGLRVLTEDFQMVNCVVANQEMIASTGGAVSLSSGTPVFTNCVFIDNVTAAINSSANMPVSPLIEDCVFTNNGTSVVNKSQINLGPSGSDTTIIRNNVIEGNPNNILSGGIAIASFLGVETNALIEENVVVGNRYGIAVQGSGIYSEIRSNIIMDNNIQNEPMLGGSGININSSGENHAIISANIITGNLWGVTLQGTSTANLGDLSAESPGMNIFENNGNGGITYALYNNTENDVMAMFNCWNGENNLTEEEAEELIVHQEDDASLGLVTFMPLGVCTTVGVEENVVAELELYPNPASQQLNISGENLSQITILDMAGKVVADEQFASNVDQHQIHVADLPAGMYVLRVATTDGVITERFVKE